MFCNFLINFWIRANHLFSGSLESRNSYQGKTRTHLLFISLFVFILTSCAAVDVKDGGEAAEPPRLQYSITGSGGKTTGP